MSKARVRNYDELVDLLSRSWGSFYLVYEGTPDCQFRKIIGDLKPDEGYHEICIEDVEPGARGFLLQRALSDLTNEKPVRTLPYFGAFVKYIGFIDSCEELSEVDRVVSRMRREKDEAISFYGKLKGG